MCVCVAHLGGVLDDGLEELEEEGRVCHVLREIANPTGLRYLVADGEGKVEGAVRAVEAVK